MNAQTRSRVGYKEPRLDYFTDVRINCSEYLYHNDDKYRRNVDYSRERATKQQQKRRERVLQ